MAIKWTRSSFSVFIGALQLIVNSFISEVFAMAGSWPWCRRTCLCCLSEEEKKTIAVDKEIKRILKQQKKKERKEIKILLLGQ